jgi:hypothetical protein
LTRGIAALALALALLTLAACGLPGVPDRAADACIEAARGYSGAVVASFSTTVGAIRALEPRAVEPGRWPDLAPDHAAILCYIDATIAKGPPPALDGKIRDPYDRVVVGVVDGKPDMITAGYRDQLHVRAP